MENQDYLRTQIAVIELGGQASRLNLEEFVRTMNRAESIVPMLNPTLYRAAQSNFEAIRELARAALKLKAAHSVLIASAVSTAMNEEQLVLPDLVM